MALSANTLRAFETETFINEFGVKASQVIYEGSAVGSTGGYARALNAGDTFLGFSMEKVTGSGTDGGVNVRVRSKGVVQLSVASVAVTDIGKHVFASDDGTFALTSNSGANSVVGTVHRFISSGVCMVAFDASGVGTTTGITILTDSTGGAANNTLAAITLPTSLTDNGGGTADGTVASLAAATTLTDSTGQSGTHDDTLAATTVPSALTGGESPTEAEHNAVLTLLGVMVQNQSDVAQKVIEIVTWQGTVQNNFKEVTTELATIRTALSTTRDCLADLAAKVNEIIVAQR